MNLREHCSRADVCRSCQLLFVAEDAMDRQGTEGKAVEPSLLPILISSDSWCGDGKDGVKMQSLPEAGGWPE